MKRTLLTACILICTALAHAQRLPKLATPEKYSLTFTPDFSNDTFTGDETITVKILKPASEIVLNSCQITFVEATVTSAGQMQKAAVTEDKQKQMATLRLPRQIKPGPATIHIKYSGILNEELRGFYLSKANGRKYAVTQFESTDARRAFPSFDEPEYKATFDITIVAAKGDTAISNGKIISDTPGPGEGKHTIRFSTSPKMSSYLVAMAVGDFEYIEGSADGIPIRVWATPGKKQLGGFALEAAEQCVRYFNRYFSIKYPFEKLDIVAFADFAAGAMENTALITYREVLLLIDEKNSSVNKRKQVAAILSHEIAHMWFGDLVTMQWWDDVWLNEGFATWASGKPITEWKPEWGIEVDDAQETTDSLGTDALKSTRPIRQAAETPGEIQELFDGIAYGKAAAVLRMVEGYIGEEDFRRGVNAYLEKYAYGNANAMDFWNTLAAASKKPVDKIMSSFVMQPGAPMVSVKTQCSGNSGSVTLEQKRYFYDRALFDQDTPELWAVPVCMKAAGEARCELLSSRRQTFAIPCPSSVLANAGATGYYRSGYATEALHALGQHLAELSAGERMRLLTDAWASVRVGKQEIGEYLTLASHFTTEHDPVVMRQLTGTLEYIGDRLVSAGASDPYQLWVRNLLRPLAGEVGWRPVSGESDQSRSLRARVLYGLGYVGRDPETLAEARKLMEGSLDGRGPLDPTLASVVFDLATLNGDAELYEKMRSHLKTTKTPEDYYRLFFRLAAFRNPQLLRRTLEFAISPEVRTQDRLSLIAAVIQNPAGTELGWEFVRAHWQKVTEVGGGFTAGIVVDATSVGCDAELRNSVRDFFRTHPVPAGQRSVQQSLERINYCVDLKSRQSRQLASWLQSHSRAAGGQ